MPSPAYLVRTAVLASDPANSPNKPSEGSTFQVAVGAAAGSIVPANPNRYSVTVKNLSTSVGTVWLGYTAGVTAATGFELIVGESITLEVTAQIFALRTVGVATVAVNEQIN